MPTKFTSRNRKGQLQIFSEVPRRFSKRKALEDARLILESEEFKAKIEKENHPYALRFLKALSQGDISLSYSILFEFSPFPGISARFNKETSLIDNIKDKKDEAVSLNLLEQFVSSHGKCQLSKIVEADEQANIAIIGSGPVGLSAAYELTRLGYKVCVYDDMPQPGGSLRKYYPEYRLSDEVIDHYIKILENFGVEFKCNFSIGKTKTLNQMIDEGYKSVLIATGSQIRFLDVPGEHLGGVMFANDLLIRMNVLKCYDKNQYDTNCYLGKKIAVVGSGIQAIESARLIARLGKDVRLFIEQTEDDIQEQKQTIQDAKADGVKIESLTKVVEIIPNEKGCVQLIRCRRMDYAIGSKDGVWELVEDGQSDVLYDVDTLVVGLSETKFKTHDDVFPELERDEEKSILLKPQSSMTSMQGVFAAGGCTEGYLPFSDTVKVGKSIAVKMHQYLTKG